MTLDEGRLPTEVKVGREIHSRVDPREISNAVLTGYYLALWRHDAPAIARGDFEALSGRPDRRNFLTALLNTRTPEEFESLERAVNGDIEFLGYGPITDFGRPSITVTAGLGRISDIQIDPRWAGATQPSYIGYDLIECANQIRRQRPEFRDDDGWSDRSESDLEKELQEYKRYLERNS
ncbi:hypothetical protein [Nocardia miyunensis]|uniref:hypothetical protein n=1 Tax=Nocardia miyunensis TaxID=282684 RepID=UPI000A6082AC|nr:hypothetical protein [Nocardia miyunensis]